jgi:predicted PurR-regulated permease PerM
MVGVVIVAVLYFTREILVPIALAVLLSFVLAPPARFLQRTRLRLRRGMDRHVGDNELSFLSS